MIDSRNRVGRALAALLVAILLTTSPRSAAGQTLPAGGLGVDRFGPEEGLPGSYIPDLAVTDDGRLWMITSGRLTSFDGLVFEEHDPSRDDAWPPGGLVGIGAGRGDTLWVTVGRQLVSVVRGRVRVRAEHDLILRDVWQEADGRLLAWDDRGVVRLGPGGFERVVELEPGWNWGLLDPLPGRPPSPGDAWIQDPRGGSVRRVHEGWVVDPLPAARAWTGVADPEVTLVARGTGTTLEVATLAGRPLGTLPATPERIPLLVDGRGLLWVRVAGGVEAYEPSTGPVASLVLGPNAVVSAALEDGEGNLWFGTVADGLYRIRAQPIRVVGAAEGVTDDQVAKVSAGGGDAVLAVESGGRVTRFSDRGAEAVFEPSRRTDVALAALTDRSGTTWVAVMSDGRGVLRGRGPATGDVEIPLPIGVSPVRIVEDAREDGVLWMVGGQVWTVRTRAAAEDRLEGPHLPSDWGAREVLVARDAAVWVAGSRGVGRLTGDGVEEFLAEDGFPTGDARALHESADGTIWIGRYFGGLSRLRDGRVGSVRAADGLWDDVVSSIVEDSQGNLWMGSNRGIHRVARDEVEAFLAGRAERVGGTGYGVSAGLRNPEASGWYAHRTSDGRLWFPTFGGLAVVDPDHVRRLEQVAPRVWVREAVGGAPTAEGAVRLERGVRRLDVAFGATLLSGQTGLRYQVRLDGVDDDWVDVGGQRQVSYGTLPSGERTFRVRAVSGRGTGSSSEALLAVSVPPLVHETPAFRLFLALVAAGALAALYQMRMRQVRARQTELERLVDERTRELRRSQRETEEALTTVEAQAEQLRSLDAAKSRFFANVSHELRTPLTLVQGPLQDVLDGRLGPTSDAVRDQVSTVLSSGQRLGELIEQLLDVARLESGELRLDLRTVDLKPLLERLASSFGALGRRRDIDFAATLPEGPVPVRADPDHLEKVYANLLGNALKFTPAGGRVRFVAEVRGEQHHEELVVCVEDDGPGIPEEERDRIFERFHQVDGSARRVHGGTGLGLAIAREVVELNGGRIDLESAPGRGSRFTVSVPVGADVQAPDSAPATDLPDDGPDRAAADLPDDALRPTVLVVEDHAELRAYLRRHLEERYRIVEAADGVEGLAEARRIVPDLVLCDLMMPGLDGEGFCREVRADPELSFLPVVMVTARASRASRLSALEGGADDYIVKPFDPEELRLRVDNLLAARKRLEARLGDEGKAMPVLGLILDGDAPGEGSDPRFVRDLDAVLAEHMGDEDFGVDGMARALAMSRATLYRKADEALGVAPMELLWRCRLRQAAHVLRETDATVSEVAYACGFKTVPHFTRRFREMFEVTPAAYRTIRRQGPS